MSSPSIVYEYGENLYINLTNRCPCTCEFCLRQSSNGVGSADSLWLEHEPGAPDVMDELRRMDAKSYGELVFCGYGEPFSAFGVMLEVCRGIRLEYKEAVIRVNTNGLGDLINGREVAPELVGLVDIISISLNTSDPGNYVKICKPEYGDQAFPAVLRFAESCKKHVPEVIFSVVDVIPDWDIKACRQIAELIGVSFRVRHFED